MNLLSGEWKVGGEAVVKTYRPAAVFFLRFVLFLAGLFSLLFILHKPFSPIGLVDLNEINKALARTSGGLLHLLGAGPLILGNLILSKGFTFRVENSCTGLDATMIYVAAVLAYPGRMREKAWGIFLGLVAIQAINLFRIIVLFYIRLWFPDYFDGAHVYAAQVLVIGFAAAFWLWWTDRLPRPAAS